MTTSCISSIHQVFGHELFCSCRPRSRAVKRHAGHLTVSSKLSIFLSSLVAVFLRQSLPAPPAVSMSEGTDGDPTPIVKVFDDL